MEQPEWDTLLDSAANDGEAARIAKERIIEIVRPVVLTVLKSANDLDPDDVVHEAFLRAWAKLIDPETGKRCSRIKKVEPYISGLAKRTSKDAIRKLVRRRQRQGVTDVNDIADPEPAVDTSVVLREDYDMAMDAVNQLTESQREAFMLRAEELSYLEISDRMGITEDAVHGLLFRAKRALKAILADPS